ncbi:4Fe-4S binding protein [Symplocastrum sp. BBK-W-15]|uniref:4Fe-4S binding protein n=2 Tax=Limnofasciculus TaxID=3064905 RepID=A0AAE3GTM6_9CYAN|nr:4Fe-4S binding protein [Limnofasciculus baicalensis BBK-W-15]
MFTNSSEQHMKFVRYFLTFGWLVLIFSLFYDPISSWLTYPNNTLSPLRINPDICVKVQGICLENKPYPLGTNIFWGAIVPLSIISFVVYGHELWRRICPLSFLSQIPRYLGWQRQKRRVDPKTGKIRYELIKIRSKSWLGKNYLYLQFFLLYLGLCGRILFFNSNALALGIFLIVTIFAAMIVGYLYGGKSWCQYFCPMAPVQEIYALPRGIFTSKAHEDPRQSLTQSMCRTVNKAGKEKSACVACQSPCIDIDGERTYWENINKPDRKWLYYGYVGLVIGYFSYYYLYAGNWDYYFSGAWSHEANQLATLLSPGFYLFNHSIGIPKLVAVPLTLGFFTLGGYFSGRMLKKLYKNYLWRHKRFLIKEQIQHRIFSLCTFFIFNLFFGFVGCPLIFPLPPAIEYLFNTFIIMVSTLWLYQTWGRNPAAYFRETIANRLRRQLGKLNLTVSPFLEGRSLEELNADEIYILAKVLPGSTRENQFQIYLQVVQTVLEQGYTSSPTCLEMLQQLRSQLGICDEEHQTVLEELGVEDSDFLNLNKQKILSN